tara:strand:+ start:343 stop:552 length:210 start_codon:yes stop_codon:yes gene_type:complete
MLRKFISESKEKTMNNNKKEKLILVPYKQDQQKRLSKLMKEQKELESIHLANQKEIQQILDYMHSKESE